MRTLRLGFKRRTCIQTDVKQTRECWELTGNEGARPLWVCQARDPPSLDGADSLWACVKTCHLFPSFFDLYIVVQRPVQDLVEVFESFGLVDAFPELSPVLLLIILLLFSLFWVLLLRVMYFFAGLEFSGALLMDELRSALLGVAVSVFVFLIHLYLLYFKEC